MSLRSALQALPPYKPGKSAAQSDVIQYKLSSNENPYPPLPSVLDAVNQVSPEMNLYPDMTCQAVTQAVANRWGVKPSCVSFGSGSVEVASQIIRAVCEEGDEVVFAWRSFEAYPILTGLAGASAVHVPLDENERHDLPAMAAAITDRTRVVLVCTPNNPTGTSVTADELHEFMEQVPQNVLVVVDEAYVHFNVDPAAARGIDFFRQYPNVVVLHTFSKAYGLAGLRIGYAIAPDYISAALRAVAIPFGVTNLAQQAALASLAAESEIEERITALVEQRDHVFRQLTEQGWGVVESQANFVWLRTGEHTLQAEEMFTRHGVIVRAFGDEGIRVSVGSPAGNQAFVVAAQDVLNHIHAASTPRNGS
ncbi:histidinol-phosphate transaminase [Kocuria tytonis]|uniref:Aromatic amino acid aminotransferase n=1 Tax=Kocuria tytonis TaxID=2054280 RepID=A0A495A3P9_9MICC|nr:histidinol-phosphate transaminase [Kocuria tytonis]